MIRNLLFVILASATPAISAIETWPALYDVKNVASDDVLNVRSGPNASSAIIASLPHDATNVEVVEVEEDRQWGRVNIGEVSG